MNCDGTSHAGFQCWVEHLRLLWLKMQEIDALLCNSDRLYPYRPQRCYLVPSVHCLQWQSTEMKKHRIPQCRLLMECTILAVCRLLVNHGQWAKKSCYPVSPTRALLAIQ